MVEGGVLRRLRRVPTTSVVSFQLFAFALRKWRVGWVALVSSTWFWSHHEVGHTDGVYRLLGTTGTSKSMPGHVRALHVSTWRAVWMQSYL